MKEKRSKIGILSVAFMILFTSKVSGYTVDCVNSYDKHGCNEVTFDLGSQISINQYQVIYDSDQDGIRDTLDKCLDTPLKTKVDKDGCHKIIEKKIIVAEEVVEKIVEIVTLKVNFNSNKYDILENYDLYIQEFADFLHVNQKYTVKIIGHTDSIGNYRKNMKLSKNRASAVYDALITLGINASRLSFDGVGPNEPIATNATSSGRTQNRRIDAILTKESN